MILAYWFKESGPPKQIYQYEIDELLEESAEEQEFYYDYKQKEKD